MDYKRIFHIKNVRMLGNTVLFSHQKETKDKTVELDDKIDEIISDTKTEKLQVENSDMAQDLMRLVGGAIDEWAKLYGMDNLPKKIIFQQALTILNAMNKLLF
jgi:hypothetical protein